MSKTKFALSFTAGGLLYNESIVVGEALLRNDHDWNTTFIEIEEKNLLQSRTPSTAKRKLQEISQRLKCLPPRNGRKGSRVPTRLPRHYPFFGSVLRKIPGLDAKKD